MLLALGVAVSLLAVAAPASAQAPPSAVDQYVEDPPDAGGSTPSGQAPSSSDLPSSVSSQIDSQAGSDAETLKTVATSSAYGAPQTSLDESGGRSVRAEDLAASEAQTDISAGEAASAALGAVQGGDSLRIVALLAGLFLITVAALATAAVRVKRRGS